MDKQQKKVIWTEGMFLRPHHFQQQERYLEELSSQQLQLSTVHSYGFVEYDLLMDKTSKENVISIRKARGIMPSGLVFNLDQTDIKPLRLPVGELRQVLYLALPKYQEGGEDIVFADEPSTNARYLVDEVELVDASEISLGSSTVQIGLPRFRLFLGDDLPSNYEVLHLAKVIEVGKEGDITLDEDFIPEVIHYRASLNLGKWVDDVYDLLGKRIEDLHTRLKQLGRSARVEMTETLNLLTLNRYRGVFHYLRQLNELHPESVYREFASLAYELATFTQANQTRDRASFPSYAHQDLQKSFEPLVHMIKKDLSYAMKKVATEIELLVRDGGLQLGKVDDMSLFKDSQFVLSVGSSLPLDVLVQRFPTQSKMGAFEKIRDLVHLQLPGIKLVQLGSTPPQLPYSDKKIYFALEKQGELWKSFETTGQIALHLAGEFPDLDLKFWALREL
ncbi:MAG: type VI secretion system baseplate subunit TssK [Pelistega sp.]|nr:type VI secretion system baseplate subunit TssK [Pelistega sp.]